MLVKMLVSMASATGAWDPGETYEMEDAEAARLVAAGIAERVEPAGPKPKRGRPETAALPGALETATV